MRPINAGDTFLWRICKALDEPPRMLAANIGVPYEDLEPLLDDRHKLAEIDREPVWWDIAAYADKRLGEIMAIRGELSKALHKDRSKRAVRIAAMQTRGGKAPPKRKTSDG